MTTVQFNLAARRPTPPAHKNADDELADAVDRVYSKYGSDLAAFIRDVQRDLQRINQGETAKKPRTGTDD